MPHIVFICTANICRSPVAEGLLRARLQALGLDDWIVSSAGTWAQWKRGAARYSVALMDEQGIDISDHLAREVTDEIVETADLVLCMQPGHAEALRMEFAEHARKVYLLSEMAGHSYGVSDPYGGPYEGYVQMVSDVTALIDEGLPRIMALAQANADARAEVTSR